MITPTPEWWFDALREGCVPNWIPYAYEATTWYQRAWVRIVYFFRP